MTIMLEKEATLAQSTQTTVGIFRLPHAPQDLPQYATLGSAGMDLRAAIETPITLEPLERTLIPTGLIMELPPPQNGMVFECQIRPRSGLSIKHGITLINCTGTVDSDYREEVKVPLVNLSNTAFTIQPGDRIAQMVFAMAHQVTLNPLPERPLAQTRVGGFGSTGIS